MSSVPCQKIEGISERTLVAADEDKNGLCVSPLRGGIAVPTQRRRM